MHRLTEGMVSIVTVNPLTDGEITAAQTCLSALEYMNELNITDRRLGTSSLPPIVDLVDIFAEALKHPSGTFYAASEDVAEILQEGDAHSYMERAATRVRREKEKLRPFFNTVIPDVASSMHSDMAERMLIPLSDKMVEQLRHSLAPTPLQTAAMYAISESLVYSEDVDGELPTSCQETNMDILSELGRMCHWLSYVPDGLGPLWNMVEAQIRAQGEAALTYLAAEQPKQVVCK